MNSGCPLVSEICFFFKVREKSGTSVKWSGKLENLQKSVKSQGISFQNKSGHPDDTENLKNIQTRVGI